MLGDDARKRAKARNSRPAQKAAATDEEPETLRARDGAAEQNEAQRGKIREGRPTERHSNARDEARNSALATRQRGTESADMDGNGLTYISPQGIKARQRHTQPGALASTTSPFQFPQRSCPSNSVS